MKFLQNGKSKKENSKLNEENGTILLTTLIVLIFATVLGMSLMVFLMSRTRAGTLELARLEALYLAEAGIAASIFELRNDIDPDGNGVGNIRARSLGEGTCWAVHDFATSTIVGTGEMNQVQRFIQIKYSAL